MMPLSGKIRIFVTVATVLVSTTVGVFAGTSKPTDDKANRAVATVISHSVSPILNNLVEQGLDIDRAEVGRYIASFLSGTESDMTNAEANAYVEGLIRGTHALAPDSVSVESQQAFIKEAASRPGAIVTPSGLVFRVIVEGEGVSPTFGDRVNVKYLGRFSDGTIFDDTGDEVVTFDLGQEIPGFVEGLQMMKPGGFYEIVVPSHLAYGSEGIPGIIPANAALEFIVTLDSVSPAQ